MATSSEGVTSEMATGTEHIVQPVAIQALTCGMPLPQFLYEGRGRSRSVGERQWTRVRAVMAWYTRLRRIKRTKSSQRWMKLRTTVQLTSAITTSAQSKKSSLKREDSFLKRFSTRQLPEIQETFDCTDEGGSSSGGGGGGADGAQDALPRRRRSRHVRPPRSVLNPDENGLFYWLGFLSLWVLYNFWTIIVRLAFPELHNNAGFTAWNICDALGDAAYVVDILAQFRTGYLEQGIMVHDSKKLSVHYLRSRAFLVDLAALVPLDWFLLAQIQPNSDDVLIRWRPALRLFRMVKIYRVWSFYYVVESRTVYPNAWRVINLIHILLLLAHWFGCFYFLISESEGFRSDWSYPYPEGDFASITRKYLASLYWSTLTLTTIGDLPTPESNSDKRPRRPVPLLRSSREVSATLVADLLDSGSLTNASFPAALIDDKSIQALPRRGLKSRLLHHVTNQGYVFTIASYLIGVFIFATIVGQVGNVITNRNASRLEFERLLDSAKLYMRHHKVPRSMQRRVQRWYDYSWSRGRIQGSGGDANTALRILPDKLKTELALHVNLSTLKKVSIFKECQPEFLHDLVLKMRSSIFTPGDMVCRRGEVAREMFIIADGILEVISETGKVLTTMKAGDFFGEIGILNLDGLNKRTADVRSVGYSELFSLSREHVLSAMKDYPEAEDILLNLGRKRLLEARKAASQHRAQMARKALLALEVKGQQQRNQTDEGNAATKLADKLRNDVKGFTNALRKSFREPRRRTRSTSPEEMELGLLTASPEVSERRKTSGSASLTSSGSRAVLKRMPRVTSSETASNDEDHSLTQPLLHQQEPPHEVIGAGLPLLQRLKLLRQKEQEQERQQQQVKLNNTLTIPGNAKEEKQLKHISFVEESVSKAKKVDSNESSPKARWTLAVIPRSSGLRNQIGNQLKPPLDVIHSCSSYESTEKPVAAASEPKSKAVSQTVQGKSALSLSPISNMPILRKRLYRKQHTISSDGDFRQSRRKIRSESIAATKSVPAKRCLRQQTIQIVTDVESVLTDIMQDVLPAAQKDAILSREPNKLFISSGNISTLTKPPEDEPKPSPPLQVRSVDRPRKLRLLKRGSKNYASIDDLSPEYTVLPFVKRLKILNERQKIAELERQLTGAVGERKDPAPEEKSEKSGASPLNSPESNETPERRSLKKILKQLSRTCSENLDQNNKTKLMRSQTVEGYAARHSNFTTLCRRDKQRYGPAQETETKEEEETKESRGMCEEKKTSTSSKESSFLGEEARGKLIRAFGEEEYVSELLIGIKQVLQERLKDIQMRFQVRIDRLEQQLEQKDAVINQLHEQLRNRSESSEHLSKRRGNSKQMEEEFNSPENAESEISESSSPEEEMEDHVASYFARSIPRGSLVNTANQLPVSRSLAPAESLLERETEETQGLPQALNPQPLWQLEFGSCWQRMENPVNITDNPRDLILDLESDLETASSSEEEYGGKCQVRGDPEEPYVPDWEVQMLAQVMEQEKIELPSTADEKSKSSVKLRNRKFGSLSLDQTSSGTKSRRQLEKWFQSYPPPLSATVDHGNSSKFSDFPVIEEDEPLP